MNHIQIEKRRSLKRNAKFKRWYLRELKMNYKQMKTRIRRRNRVSFNLNVKDTEYWHI